MSDVVDVDPASLRTHAAAVNTFMDNITGATASAGNTLNVQAFGVCNLEAAQILQAWTQSANQFIQLAVTAGHGVASAVNSMADMYEEQEKANQACFTSIQSSMPEQAI